MAFALPPLPYDFAALEPAQFRRNRRLDLVPIRLPVCFFLTFVISPVRMDGARHHNAD